MAEERLQRRLAAILSADVVGYSRLMGLDEAGTLSRLNALRRGFIDPTIAAHAGRAIFVLGFSAAIFGRWVEEGGPRRAMFTAALCWAGGFIISAIGV